ncbi:MAG TPA: alpha/beta hydrolase [Solirubrobacteraceae bacterium]|jgi:pimeloyl-ACP methyl ester carboxylesterase|nr:alpha/beta hydrolase [Solirubrobacteraceae bacterium]
MSASTTEIIDAHRRAGRTFTAAGARSFVREQGEGEAVVCVHGMWGSSFLYRKVLGELAGRGLRGISFDLPGFGLAQRPRDYDYSWSGLGRFATAAVDALKLDRFHLVVHDIGGPVGFELAAARRERIASITLLNTIVDVTEFKPPWSMEPFRHRGIGEAWLAGIKKPMFRRLMALQGLGDPGCITKPELNAYVDLMRGDDNGRGFLQVSRHAERTAEKQELYRSTLGNVPYPVQIVWAAEDPAMKLTKYGEPARRVAGLKEIQTLPGKHFPQEDQAPAIAERVAAIARRSRLTALKKTA